MIPKKPRRRCAAVIVLGVLLLAAGVCVAWRALSRSLAEGRLAGQWEQVCNFRCPGCGTAMEALANLEITCACGQAVKSSSGDRFGLIFRPESRSVTVLRNGQPVASPAGAPPILYRVNWAKDPPALDLTIWTPDGRENRLKLLLRLDAEGRWIEIAGGGPRAGVRPPTFAGADVIRLRRTSP